MKKRSAILISLLVIALVGVLLIPGVITAQEEEEEAPPRGCGIATGCHSPTSKYTLQYEITNLEEHPDTEVDSVDDCTQCHAFDTVEDSGTIAPNLANSLHFVHMTSSHFEGNCFSCHMVTDEGEMGLYNFVAQTSSEE